MANNEKNSVLLLNSLPIYGGGEFFVYLLAKKLNSRGWNVHVSCIKDTELYNKCLKEDIKLFPLNYPVKHNRGVLKIARKISAYIKHHKIEIVHSNTNYDRTAGAIAAKFSGIKHVTNIHSFHSIQHNLTHLVRNRMLTDVFAADGNSIRELLIEKDNINPSKITTINLGIEPANTDNGLNRIRIREELSIPENAVVIGNAARMVPFKGQEYLLKAFSFIADIFPLSRLLIIGDGELLPMLKSLAEDLGLSEKVIFAGFRKDIYEVFTAFDIYAHTSLEGGGEAFPFSVLHALERSLPLVLTNAGEMKIMVKDGYNGFLCEVKNAEQISAALKKLLENSEIRKTFGENSCILFNSEFTADKMTDSIEEIYRKLIL